MLKSKSVISVVLFSAALLLALSVSAVLVYTGIKYYGSDFRGALESSFKYFFLWRIFIYGLITWLWLRVLKPSILNKSSNNREAVVERLKVRQRWFMVFICVYEASALYSAFSFSSVGG
jgi:hypothetical protein